MKEILLIEDTETDALLLERALRAVGVTNSIRHVSTGADALLFLNANEQALQKGARSRLAVVFFDLKLPDRSGFELLKLLQERRAFSNTLKVVVSQIEDMERIRKAYRLGADSFITKPIGQIDLKELIAAFPDNWLLSDSSSAQATAQAAAVLADADPHAEAVQVWTKNREIIEVLRTNMQRLRTQLSDNEETFAIIETLTEELRTAIGSADTEFTSRKRGI